MIQVRSEDIEKLLRLTTQLYAAIMISSEEGFWQWPPEIRTAYLWLLTDVSQEVRDTLRTINLPQQDCEPERKRA